MRIKTQGANANQNATKNIATHSSSTRVEWRFDRSATGLAKRSFRAALLMAAIAMAGVCSQAHALDANLLPKYGLQPKTEVQKAADAKEQDSITVLAKSLLRPHASAKVSYGTEGGFFQRSGTPTIICGPGSIEQAHKADEYVDLSQLQQCEQFMDKLVQRLSGNTTAV